jgi:UDP-N-acetylmuramyl tripeptide synthase
MGLGMKKLLIILAILLGKIAIWLSHLLGKQGSNFPGQVARRIYPSILRELAANINEEIIVITGTNGKTTSTNMMAAIIKEKGYSLVHNQAGANMMAGITAAFVNASDLSGRQRFDYALLETDEANVPLLLQELTPKVLLITNFFRDQLDRYGELDYTINLIKDSVRNTDIELVLNADDPLVVHFQNETGLHCWYFGFDNTEYDSFGSMESREGRYCVFCGSELQYERYHYAQLGRFSCPACGSHNPKPNFCGHDLQMNPRISFKVNNIDIKSPYQGFYNAYNILAAVSVSKLLGIQDDTIQRAIAAYQPRAGRMEEFFINGKRVVIILVKNPTGLNQTLSAIVSDKEAKDIFFALNDNAADGRDISWIWDAEMEIINSPEAQIATIVASGLRSGDLALRVKYSGFDTDAIIIKTDLKNGIETVVNKQGRVSYILSTYTALFECRKILVKMQEDSGEILEKQFETEN